MRTRLEVYRAITNLCAGDVHHLRQHLASIRPMLLKIMEDHPEYVSPALVNLYGAAAYGTHPTLIKECQAIHQRWRGK